MKKFIAVALTFIAVAGICSCEKNHPHDTKFYVPSDFTSMESCIIETTDRKYETQLSSDKLTLKSEGDIYVFAANGYDMYRNGEKISVTDTNSENMIKACRQTGLIYTAMPGSEYIMADTSGRYMAEPEKFFFAAENVAYLAGGGEADKFEEYFAKTAPVTYGNFKDYRILLDCSMQDTVILTIRNIRRMTVCEYKFTKLNDVHVALPEE